jgi:hypothetical protein
MADELTDYGFTWGPIELTRVGCVEHSDRSHHVLRIKTQHRDVNVYVSRTGRSVRVFRDGKELT